MLTVPTPGSSVVRGQGRIQEKHEVSDPNLPKYRQITEEIIARIKGGELQPGMRTPSEADIIAGYGVSNTTARKALREIEIAGWATRIKGKGTYVRQRDVVRSAQRILSFSRNMAEAGYTPSTKVLHRHVLSEGHSSTINGRRYSMKGPLLKLHRLRFGDGIPMLLEVRYVNLSLCPGIQDEPLDASLYEVYERRYGLHLSEVHQMLSTVILDSGTREFFDLGEPTPGMLVEGVTFCGKEIILEIERSIYRGDKYRFAVRAT
jgi:GntR family transcriptional regulator